MDPLKSITKFLYNFWAQANEFKKGKEKHLHLYVHLYINQVED